MTNIKKVPFDLEKWKADGSRVDRLEARCGKKIKDIHVFDPSVSQQNISCVYENKIGIFGLFGDGKYRDDGIENGYDLFMYVEQPKEIMCGDWRATKMQSPNNVWQCVYGNVIKGYYHRNSDKFVMNNNSPVNGSSLLALANLIVKVTLQPE